MAKQVSFAEALKATKFFLLMTVAALYAEGKTDRTGMSATFSWLTTVLKPEINVWFDANTNDLTVLDNNKLVYNGPAHLFLGSEYASVTGNSIAAWDAEPMLNDMRNEMIRLVFENSHRTGDFSTTPVQKIWQGYGASDTSLSEDVPDTASPGIMRLGKGEIKQLACSPDHRWLALATYLGVWLYPLDRPNSARLLSPKSQAITVSWSPDSSRLAGSYSNNTIQVWDVVSGGNSITVETSSYAASLAWSPDGNYLAIGSGDKIVRIWHAPSEKTISRLEGHSDTVGALAWSPDGRQIASGSSDKTVRIWDVTTQKAVVKLQGHSGVSVVSLAWAPDGTRLISVGGEVIIWDVASGRMLATLKGSFGLYDRAIWPTVGPRLATVSSRLSVRVLDVESQVEIASLQGHTTEVERLTWSPDARQLASVGENVRLWDISSGGILSSIPDHISDVYCLAWSPDGKQIASGSQNGAIYLWDSVRGKMVTTLVPIEPRWADCIAWSPTGHLLASAHKGFSNSQVYIWDVKTGQVLKQLKPRTMTGETLVLTWSPDGSQLTAGTQYTVDVWDAVSGHCISSVKYDRTMTAQCADWFPGRKWLAIGSEYDGTVQIWDIGSNTMYAEFTSHTKDVRSLAWSPDGNQLASGSWDGTAFILEINSKKPSRLMQEYSSINSIAWSPNGKWLATGSHDWAVRVWDAASKQLLATFEEQRSFIFSVAWSPNSQRLASGSSDGTVCIWDMDTVLK